GDATFAVTCDVTCDLTATGRMAYMDGVLQVQVRRERREVVGVVIHIVSAAGLARASVTSPVMGNDAIAVVDEKHHLRVPVVGGKRPAVRENDGLAGAPVLVEDLCAVLCGDRAHVPSPVEGLRFCRVE